MTKTLNIELKHWDEYSSDLEYTLHYFAKEVPGDISDELMAYVGYGVLFADEWQLKPDTHNYELTMTCHGVQVHHEATPA